MSAAGLLAVIRSLVEGARHSRYTLIANPAFKCGSLTTADRWIQKIASARLHGFRVCKAYNAGAPPTTWLEYKCVCPKEVVK